MVKMREVCLSNGVVEAEENSDAVQRRRAAEESEFIVDEPGKKFLPYACNCDGSEPLVPEAERVSVVPGNVDNVWTYKCSSCGMNLGFVEVLR